MTTKSVNKMGKVDRAKLRYAALLEAVHDGNPESRGCRVYNREGTEFGLVQCSAGVYTGDAGFSRRVRVLWPDGKFTKPCVRGLVWSKALVAWKIGN